MNLLPDQIATGSMQSALCAGDSLYPFGLLSLMGGGDLDYSRPSHQHRQEYITFFNIGCRAGEPLLYSDAGDLHPVIALYH